MGEFIRRHSQRLSGRLAKRMPRVVRGLDRTQRDPDPNRAPGLELGHVDRLVRECVICVGSTGSGKSATIEKATSRTGISSDSADRKTSSCALYEDDSTAGTGYVWVDTVGWGDRDIEDEESFQELLRFLDNNGLNKIQAVIWNIIPNIRKDSALEKQARFIDLVGKREIWHRVIINCKQSMNPERDGLGAIELAKELNPRADVKVIGYRFHEDSSFNDEQREKFADAETRRLFNVKTNSEIRDILMDAIKSRGPNAFNFSLKSARCMDCSERGDPRLMPLYCHMESHHVHPGLLKITHFKNIEVYHESDYQIAVHDGTLRKTWYGKYIGKRGKRYSCCEKKPGNPGCKVKWQCCGQQVEDSEYAIYPVENGCARRYACCKKHPEEAGEGCSQRYECCGRKQEELGCEDHCKRCEKAWGTPAGR